MKISDRISRIPSFGIDLMAHRAGKVKGTLRLENADTNLSPPKDAIEATKEAIGQFSANSWLPFEGLTELRETVAERCRLDYGLEYDPNNEVVITSGGMEGMVDALLATTDLGDKVVLMDPTYAGMIYRVRLAGCIPVFCSLRKEEGWRLDLNELESGTEGAKMIFMRAPNMPTGTVYTKKEIEAITKLAKEKDLVVLYNAAFDKIVFDNRKNYNPASFPGMKERTIIVGSVSKNYNMIGWRIGWVISDREITDGIKMAHLYNGTVAGGAAQMGAVAALKSPWEYVQECVKIYQRRRDVLVGGLGEIGLPCVSPKGGWYMLADTKDFEKDSYKFADYLLREAGVATTPMRDWGKVCCKGHIRLIFSTEPEDRLKDAVTKIGVALKKLKNSK